MKRILWSCALFAGLVLPLCAKAEWVCRKQSGEVSVGGGDAHQEPDIQICEWVGGGTPPGGGTGGGTGGQYCPVLLMSKPSGCTSEIPVQGADYAADKFMLGSGLATALSNLSNGNISSQARDQIFSALAKHTEDYSDIRKSVNDNNVALIDGMVQACDYQRQFDLANPPMSPHPGGVSPGLKACLGTVERLNAEANLSFTSFFQAWLNRTGIVLTDLGIPQTVINWFAPENSLSAKIEAANEQNACNLWFGEVRRNGC